MTSLLHYAGIAVLGIVMLVEAARAQERPDRLLALGGVLTAVLLIVSASVTQPPWLPLAVDVVALALAMIVVAGVLTRKGWWAILPR